MTGELNFRKLRKFSGRLFELGFCVFNTRLYIICEIKHVQEEDICWQLLFLVKEISFVSTCAMEDKDGRERYIDLSLS